MVLPTPEKEYTPFENALKVQVPPLSVEVSIPDMAAANNFVPALAKEWIPVNANCSTRSHEAPSVNDLQIKLSEATMIALSLTSILSPLSMGEATSCQVFPLLLDSCNPAGKTGIGQKDRVNEAAFYRK